MCIRDRIRTRLGLTASVGIAPNKFLAKLGSGLEKPVGFVVVDPARVQEFLDPLPVERVWGVGRAAARVLETLGARTVGDLRQIPEAELRAHFGRWGERLAELARGWDERPVAPDGEARSVSHETTFAVDVSDRDVLRARLLELTDQVGRRLRRQGLLARGVQVKVRFHDFRTITRAARLPRPGAATDALWRAVEPLWRRGIGAGHPPVRLIGVGANRLQRRSAGGNVPRQGDLFGVPPLQGSAGQGAGTGGPPGGGDAPEHEALDEVADRVRERFGAHAVRRARTLTRSGKDGPGGEGRSGAAGDRRRGPARRRV